jgi:anti-sigma regulatory factor (Ser/Thr protein kinase)
LYEAEITAVIHANGGHAEVEIFSDRVEIKVTDHGPGIPNVELAMQAGWSTAPDIAREMGFGAGMGLPNIKKNSDCMHIDTEVGKGTTVTIEILFR